MLATPAAC